MPTVTDLQADAASHGEEVGTEEVVTLTFTPSGDEEIDAMRVIGIAIQFLDDDARSRVTRWASERYGRTDA